MKFVVIENSIVKNIVKCDPEFAAQNGWIQSNTAKIGDLYDTQTGEFSTPEKTPEEIAAEEAQKIAARKAERTQPEKLAAALEVIAKQVVKPALVNLSETDILAVSVMFPDWKIGVNYSAGDVVNYNGEPVEILQPHTSQSDWLPPDVPALYKRFIADGQVTAWVQPQGAHDAYQIGQQVTHNGQTWESTAADNVWEPGVYGWVRATPSCTFSGERCA